MVTIGEDVIPIRYSMIENDTVAGCQDMGRRHGKVPFLAVLHHFAAEEKLKLSKHSASG